jgi:hypothetical protein
MPEASQYKRASAARKKITEINPEKDIRVMLLGRIVDKSDGLLVLDDGSATAEIVADQEARINDLVRAFCRVLPLEEGYELRAEIVQGMKGLDLELYRKVFS